MMRTKIVVRMVGGLFLQSQTGLVAATAVVETLDHRHYEGVAEWSTAGNLRIRDRDGNVQSVALNQIQFASLPATSPVGNPLPPGWRAVNIQEVQGSSGARDGVFTLRVAGGTAPDDQKQAVHFVQRRLRGNGEVVGRVLAVDGSKDCLAGVMLRENLEPPGGFAFLGVTPDRRLRLHTRQRGWHERQSRDWGAVTLPVWLKLTRQEKGQQVTAWRSAEGARWQPLATNTLGGTVEAFPAGSDHWRPLLYAGLGIAGSDADSSAGAQLDHAAVIAHGLLGEYFADDRFQEFRFSRADDSIDFHWGGNPPAPDIAPDHFSIRWTGQLVPRFSEKYRFLLEADDEARLWVDGQEVKTGRFATERDAALVPLMAEQSYPVKIEYKDGAGPASIRLGWSSHRQFAEVIPASQLRYTYTAQSPEEEAMETATNALWAEGLWLRQGSFIAGAIESADATAIRVAFGAQKAFPVLNSQVARVIFRRPRSAKWFAHLQDEVGIMLNTGDFLRADFLGIEKNTLKIESVLFGQRTYSLAQGEVVALWLHPYEPVPAELELRLNSGSRLRAHGLRTAGQILWVQDTSLGEIAVSPTEVVEIRRLPGAP